MIQKKRWFVSNLDKVSYDARRTVSLTYVLRQMDEIFINYY